LLNLAVLLYRVRLTMDQVTWYATTTLRC